MNRFRQVALNTIKYPLRHPSNQGYPVTTLIYTKDRAIQNIKTTTNSQVQEPLWKTRCEELVDVEYKGLQKVQMKEHLNNLIYNGKRTSDLLKLYAAQNRAAAIDSGLKQEQLPSMSKDIYDFITQNRKVSENRLHEVQELGVKAADLNVVYEELPDWNFSVTAINPTDVSQYQNHPLAKSHIEKSFDFKNAQQCNKFVERIGEFLNKMDHHPEWELHQEGGRLSVKMTSHFLFNNVTNSDVKVARQLDTLYYATKISSLQYLVMRIGQSLPFGPLLMGLFGASLLGILMIKNYMSFNVGSLNLFDLETKPETIVSKDGTTKYLISDTYSPHFAETFDKEKNFIYNRPDHAKNDLVSRVFKWDRGSQGYEINKCLVKDLDYAQKESETCGSGGSHANDSK